jgi:hypothetical protein
MQGYVISMLVDNEPTVMYWDGSSTNSNVDEALFIDSLATARQTAGSLQSSHTDRKVDVLEANKGIQLTATTPPTLHSQA